MQALQPEILNLRICCLKGSWILKSTGRTSMNLIIKKRLLVFFGIIFFIMLSLLLRVGWVQVVQGPGLKKLAVEQWNSVVKIDAKRGEILDRNGEKLAVSASCKRVDVYIPDVVKAEAKNKNIKNEIASKIAGILGQSQEDILKKLNVKLSNGMPASSATIGRRIDNDKGDAISKLDLPGIIVSEDTKRFYPNDNFLSQVLGFTNIDGQGQEGIESEYEKELKGISGTMVMQTDMLGRQLPFDVSKINAPVNGNNITLTIDDKLQIYLEKALEKAVADNKAKSATAIIMDPKTGEILAMSSKPDFNPNDPRNPKNFKSTQDMLEAWKNRAVAVTFEPGSVFKLITAVAALDQKIVDDSTRFNDPGYLDVAGHRIYDWNRRNNGVQDFAEILQNSSNVGFMQLGIQLGKDKLYKYIDDFGLGQKTGIDVKFEETGYKVSIDKVGPVELANIAFGQGIVVTPIQLTAAYAAIANGGKMMVPHLVKSIDSTDQNGNVTSRNEIQPKVSRQVVNESIANKMLGYLETVVTVGGGHGAYVDGYRIAGKTGTAQKAENGEYPKGKYVSTFVGMAPVDNPQYVVYVSVDEPDPSNYYASHVVAPVSGQIFKDIFTIKNIQPDKNSGSSMVPDVVGLSQKDAENRLKFNGFTVTVSGKGTMVEKVSPLPGTSLKAGSKITLTLGSGSNVSNKVAVPNLSNMNQSQAQSTLDSLGLKLAITGNGLISDQNPKAGTTVNKGASISAQADGTGD
jgi:Cell division protein FtsI/penicillin-binding protein 2